VSRLRPFQRTREIGDFQLHFGAGHLIRCSSTDTATTITIWSPDGATSTVQLPFAPGSSAAV
jgi:hypothetical protein